jgi:hypothetical protein
MRIWAAGAEHALPRLAVHVYLSQHKGPMTEFSDVAVQEVLIHLWSVYGVHRPAKRLAKETAIPPASKPTSRRTTWTSSCLPRVCFELDVGYLAV